MLRHVTCFLALAVVFIRAQDQFFHTDAHGLVITDEDRKQMLEIAKAVKRFKRNPFLTEEEEHNSRTSDTDLREKEVSGSDDDSETSTFHGSTNDYCDKFEQHFSYYCVGDVEKSTTSSDYVFKKFCPSYKLACPNKAVTSSSSLTSWPSDPFEKKITVPSTTFSDRTAQVDPSAGRKSSRRKAKTSEEDYSASEENEDAYYMELRKRYPCKPDCDRRIFPHCTEECKCDYIYPQAQRFCNPPPMPIFLNTCKMWYHGCPKYDRYHYAAQFVYSKAEKGKVLPGVPDPGPFGYPPNGAGAAALAPLGRRYKREATGDIVLFVPPPIPRPSKLSDSKKIQDETDNTETKSVAEPSDAPKSRAILMDYLVEKNKKQTHRRKKSHHKKRRRRHRHHYNSDITYEVQTTTRAPTPREVWRTLKAINGITDGGIRASHEPATLKSGAQGGLDGFLETVAQSHNSADAGRQWASVAQNPQKFTTDLVGAIANQNPDEEEEKPTGNGTVTDVDFDKIKPRISNVNSSTKEDNKDSKGDKPKAFQGSIPVLGTDSAVAARSGGEDTFRAFEGLSDSRGIVHQPRSRSPFTKPGLWEPNPADPHNRDPTNRYWYHPESVQVDWLNGQMTWGGHWAVPAAGTGGTDGFSSLHFPTVGQFLNLPDDYD